MASLTSRIVSETIFLALSQPSAMIFLKAAGSSSYLKARSLLSKLFLYAVNYWLLTVQTTNTRRSAANINPLLDIKVRIYFMVLPDGQFSGSPDQFGVLSPDRLAWCGFFSLLSWNHLAKKLRYRKILTFFVRLSQAFLRLLLVAPLAPKELSLPSL